MAIKRPGLFKVSGQKQDINNILINIKNHIATLVRLGKPMCKKIVNIIKNVVKNLLILSFAAYKGVIHAVKYLRANLPIVIRENLIPNAKKTWYSFIDSIKWINENRSSLPSIVKNELIPKIKERWAIFSSKASSFNKRHDHVLVTAAIAIVTVLFSAYAITNYTLGMRVYIGEDHITTVNNQESFDTVLSNFDKYVSDQIGETYKNNLEFFTDYSLVKKSEIQDSTDINQKLLDHVVGISKMFVLKVDGKVVGANEDKQAIEQMLSDMKNKYATGAKDERLEFDKDVSVEQSLCKVSIRKSIPELQLKLAEPVDKEVTYTVQKGDTISEIAPQYGMSVSSLLALNSGLDPTCIKPGDDIIVSKEVPMLSVRSVRTLEYTRDIPFGTEQIKDSSIYLKQQKVKQEGAVGQESVVAEVVTENGVEVDRNILSTETLKEPVTKLVLVGTKTPPPTAATGIFKNPTSGIVTSRYGYRGREFHTGLDIAGSVGTAIYAADGGTVTKAGWNGNYGYCIIIDHGNGYQTLYGHCSKLYVSVGDKVAKGAKIAAMGETGRATGPHLHFEVRLNGSTVNPAKYIGR